MSKILTDEALAYQLTELQKVKAGQQSNKTPGAILTDEAQEYQLAQLEKANYNTPVIPLPERYTSDAKLPVPASKFTDINNILEERTRESQVPAAFIDLTLSLNKDKKLTKDQELKFQEQFKQYSQYNLTTEDEAALKHAFLVNETIDQYKKTKTDTVRNMYYDEEKLSKLTVDQFAALDTLRYQDEQNKNIEAPWSFNRYYDFNNEYLLLNRKLSEEKITPEEYQESLIGLQRKYDRTDDSELWKGVVGMLPFVKQTVTENPSTAITGLALAIPTKGRSLQVALGVGAGEVSFHNARAEMALQIYNDALNKGEDISFQQALEKATGASYMVGAVNGLASLVNISFLSSGISKGISAFFQSSKVAEGAIASKLVKEKLTNFFSDYLSGFASLTAVNAATVGAEYTIRQEGINQATGSNENSIKAGLQAIYESSGVLLTSSALMAGATGLGSGVHLVKSLNNIKLNADAITTRAKMKETLKNAANEEQAKVLEESLKEVNDRDVYIDAQTAKKVLEENGYDPENLGEYFKNLEEKIEKGEDIVISEVDYAKYFTDNELGNILDLHTRTSKDGRSLHEIQKDVNEQQSRLKEIEREQQIKNQQKQQELFKIQSQIAKDLKLSGIANKNIEPVTKLIGNVLTALADKLDMNVKEVFEKVPLKFKLADKVIDFNEPRKNNLGRFDKETFELSITNTNDIPTIIHEVGHYLLESFMRLQENEPKLKDSYNKFAEWASLKKSWSKLSERERYKIHEDFVYTLQQMMIEPTKHDILTASLFNMFTDIMKKAYGDDAMYMREEYMARFNHDLPPVNDAFKQFIRTIIFKDLESDQANLDYPMKSIFEQSKDISLEDIKKAEEQWTEGEEIARAENKQQILNMRSILFNIGDKIDNISKNQLAIFRRVYNKRFESIKKDVLENRNTLDEQTQKYRRTYKLKQELLTNHKINRNYANKIFNKNEYALLEKAKLLSNKGVKDESQITSLLRAYNRDKSFGESLREIAELPDLNTFAREKTLAEMDNTTLNHLLIDADFNLASKHINKVRLKAVQDEGAMIDKIFKGLFNKSLKQIKNAAEVKNKIITEIDNMPLKKASPRAFLSQAKRARYLAAKALRDAGRAEDVELKKSFYMEAAKQNLAEQMALEKLINSTTRRKKIDKKLVSHKQFFKRKHENYDGTILSIGNHLLISVGLKKGFEKTPLQLETLKRLAPEVIPIYDKYMRSELSEIDINSITFSEAQKLVDALDAIKQEALESRTLELEEVNKTKAEAVQEMLDVLEEKPVIKKGVINDDTAVTALSKKATLYDRLKNGFIEYTIKMETYLKTLDGKDDGVFHRYIYQPMRKAMTNFQLESNRVHKKLQTILDSVDAKGFKEPFETNLFLQDGEKKARLVFGGKDGKYSNNARLDVIGFLLHLGNESNLKKLAKGYGWEVSEIKQFIDDAIKAKLIDKTVMKAVQEIWDTYAELNNKSQLVHKKLTGKLYDELPNIEIKVDGETFKGGYVPLVTNKFINNVSRATDIDSILNNTIADFNDGFTKARSEAIVKASLDVEDLIAGVTTMLKYNELVLPAKEVLSLIDNNAMQEALAQKVPHAHELITDWVQRTMQVKQSVATGEWGRALNTLTSKIGKTIMAGNFTNVLQNYTNLIVATVKKDMNPLYLSKHAVNGFTREDIMAKSDFMKLRFESDQILSTEIVDNIIVGGNKVKRFNNFLDKNAYFFQKIAQNHVDKIVWGAAYESFKDNNANKYKDAKILEERSVAYADSTVRTTQGSFDVSDIAKIEVGSPLVKTLNQFCGYFLTLGNLMTSETKMAKTELQGLKLAQRYAIIQLMVGVVPAIVGELIAKTAAGDLTKEDEDPERWWNDTVDTVVGAPLRTYFSMIPYIGRAGVYLTQKLAGRDYYNDSVLNVPAITMTGAAYRSFVTLAQSLFDDSVEVKGRHINDALTIFGLFNPFANAVGKRIGVAYDLYQGNISGNSTYDVIRALVIGKASQEQKE